MEKFLGVDDISSVEVEKPEMQTTFTATQRAPEDKQATTQPSEAASQDAQLAASLATSCTINPDDIRSRTKKQLHQKKNRDAYRKSLVVKGESSAVTRSRRDNRDVVKQYAGWEEF